jgi:hypothetical protein
VNSISTIEKPKERAKRSATTFDPGSPGQVRRARGIIPANRRGTPNMKSHGHDTSASRVNGHGPASSCQTAAASAAPLETGRAASDDTRDFPTAAAASSAAAGTERDVCAEVAPPSREEKPPRSSGGRKGTETGTSRASSEPPKQVDIPPGSEPLPEDGPGFVDAIHAHVDLYLACARLVKSGDEKIAQRMVERLLEMSYGKSPAASGDEVPQIIFDAPRPIGE